MCFCVIDLWVSWEKDKCQKRETTGNAENLRGMPKWIDNVLLTFRSKLIGLVTLPLTHLVHNVLKQARIMWKRSPDMVSHIELCQFRLVSSSWFTKVSFTTMPASYKKMHDVSHQMYLFNVNEHWARTKDTERHWTRTRGKTRTRSPRTMAVKWPLRGKNRPKISEHPLPPGSQWWELVTWYGGRFPPLPPNRRLDPPLPTYYLVIDLPHT